MVPKWNLLHSAGQVLQLLQGCVTSWTGLLCTAGESHGFWQILYLALSAQMWIFANINTKMSKLPTLILNISVANSHNFPWAPKISKVVLSVWCLLINCKLTGLAHLLSYIGGWCRRNSPPHAGGANVATASTASIGHNALPPWSFWGIYHPKSIRMSHWCRRATEGGEFWISSKRLKLLRKAGHLQLIQNLVPSVARQSQCDIRIWDNS